MGCFNECEKFKNNEPCLEFTLFTLCDYELAEHDKKVRADALSIDMDKPMHFTDEQKAWIKNYIIINAKRQRADAIDEYNKKLNTSMDTLEEKLKDKEIRNLEDVTLSIRCGMNLLAEQLKSQN